MKNLHHLNIIIHVIAGSLGLLIGLVAIIVSKRSQWHRRWGWIFTGLLAIICFTGLMGVLVFERHTFLLVITLLAGYNGFSGIRTLRLQGNRPQAIDITMPFIVMAAAGYYLYHLKTTGMYWSPVITYITMGALFPLMIYDLCRWWMPAIWRKKAMVYEHVYKMLGAFSGILSAFSGTVFPQYQPWSQFLPSVLGFLFFIAIFIWLGSQHSTLPNNRSSVPEA